MSVLSGGEQSRLRLCMLMDEEINLLILDEPTNHLDIAVPGVDRGGGGGRTTGTLLFVSHDRYFIDRFATRVWELEDGQVTDFRGSYGEYRAARESEAGPGRPRPRGGAGGEEGEAPAARRHQEPGEGGGRRRAGGG